MPSKISILLFVIILIILIVGFLTDRNEKALPVFTPPINSKDLSFYTAPDTSSRFIRIRVLGDNGKWHLTGIKSARYYAGPYYSPDDVLLTIKELKPDVLDRFISGPQNLDATLEYFDKPTGEWIKWDDKIGGAGGFSKGTVGSFLIQAMQNGAPEAYFIPRLDSEFYNSKGATEFFSMAQDLYKSMEDLGVLASRRYLSLDNWGSLSKQQTKNEVLSRLYAQGWSGIGVTSLLNYHLGINTEDPKNSATWSSFNVDPENNWKPNKEVLEKIHDESNIQLVLLYIDFPEPMGSFIKVAPDEEARVLERIAFLQAPNSNNPHETGFNFVYPIAQGANAFSDDWDSKARITTAEGPYKGISIYQFIRDQLIAKYSNKK